MVGVSSPVRASGWTGGGSPVRPLDAKSPGRWQARGSSTSVSDQRASALVRGEMFCAELRSRWSKTAERKNGVCSLRDRRRIGEQAERGFRCGQSERRHRARRAIGATGAQHRLHSRHAVVRGPAGQRATQLGNDRARPAVAGSAGGAITSVADLHGHTCDLDDPGTPATSVTIVREGDQGLDYLVLFDSVIVLDGPSELKVVTDRRVDAFAQAEESAIREHPIGSPAHQAGVTSWSRRSGAIATNPAGTGSPGPSRRARDLEASHPAGARWPRYKASDDATAAICFPS